MNFILSKSRSNFYSVTPYFREEKADFYLQVSKLKANFMKRKIIEKWNKLSLDDKARYGAVAFCFGMMIFLMVFGLLMKAIFEK